MQKEFEKQQKIEHLDDQQKKEFEQKLKQEEEAKKHHKPVNVDSFSITCFGFEFCCIANIFGLLPPHTVPLSLPGDTP